MKKAVMTITIAGASIHGYDTIAKIIADTLEEKGISTKITPCFSDPRCASLCPVDYIANAVHVNIVPTQAHRSKTFPT